MLLLDITEKTSHVEKAEVLTSRTKIRLIVQTILE